MQTGIEKDESLVACREDNGLPIDCSQCVCGGPLYQARWRKVGDTLQVGSTLNRVKNRPVSASSVKVVGHSDDRRTGR